MHLNNYSARMLVACACLSAITHGVAAQGAANGKPRPRGSAPVITLVLSPTIDDTGSVAVVVRQPGRDNVIVAQLTEAAASPRVMALVLRTATYLERENRNGRDEVRIYVPRRTRLRPVADADVGRTNEVLGRLLGAGEIDVPGMGRRRGIKVTLSDAG